MSDKRAFEAKLDAYGDACYRREHSASARAAVLAAYDAAGRDGQYLADGMRFKLAATRSGAAAEFRSFPAELAGKWVALVDATDDKHLRTHPAPKSDAAADWVCVPREPTEEMLRAGHAAYMHGEGGEGGHGGYELDRQLYRAMIAASPARGGEKCRYCDGSGEIETDNNGPIAPCPICRPAAMSREAQG